MDCGILFQWHILGEDQAHRAEQSGVEQGRVRREKLPTSKSLFENALFIPLELTVTSYRNRHIRLRCSLQMRDHDLQAEEKNKKITVVL